MSGIDFLVDVVCISDTHGHHRECDPLPAGDILVHAGDFTRYGRLDDLIDFKAWLDETAAPQFQHVVVVDGNHEINAPWRRFAKDLLETVGGASLARALGDAADELEEQDELDQAPPDLFTLLRASSAAEPAPLRRHEKIHFLADELVEVLLTRGAATRTLRLFGTEFYWPATAEIGRLGTNAILEVALSDVGYPLLPATPDLTPADASDAGQRESRLDVLVTHGPCKGLCDGGEGCPYMLFVAERLRPRLVVSGHIHDAHGQIESSEGGTIFLNATICGRTREARRKGWDPRVVTI